MKKSHIYFVIGAMLLSFTSCQDFLTVEQKGKVTIPSFLSSPEGLEGALYGTYNKLLTYREAEFMKYADVSGNMLTLINTGDGSEMASEYNFTSDETQETGAVGRIWQQGYECMANANNIIAYAPKVKEDYPLQADVCDRVLGEALFIRALTHFDIVQCYGQPWRYTADASHLGVPVLTKTPGPDDNPARASVAQVYDRVIADLKESERILSGVTNRNYKFANLRAVHALLSRVYLYKGEWQSALDESVKAIQGESLPAGAQYLDVFRNLSYDGESIFRLDGTDQRGKQKAFYMSVALPADTLMSLFDDGDIRLQLLGTRAEPHCYKYESVGTDEVNRNDPFVLRLAEQYLNAAEAAYMLSDYATARTYVGAILTRAVDADYSAQKLAAVADGEQLLRLIKVERMKELCFEGHNFYDIRRWGDDLVREWKTNSSLRTLTYPNDRYVLPISRYELNANLSIVPNPGVNK